MDACQDLFDRLDMLRKVNGETTVHVSFVEVRTRRLVATLIRGRQNRIQSRICAQSDLV